MMKIPNTNKQWEYSTESDVMGNVVNCHNITFDKKGYATLNSKMGEVFGTDQGATDELQTVQSFVYNPLLSKIHTFGTKQTHDWEPSVSGVAPFFTRASSSADGDVATHALYWNGKSYLTTQSTLRTWDGTTNTQIDSFSSINFHPICLFESKNKIAIGDGNLVKLYNTSNVLDTLNQLVIPAHYTITWVKYFENNLYIGTINTTNENAKMFVWNGVGTEAQKAVDCGGVWSWAGDVWIAKSTIVQINSRGQLMQYSGGGFTQLAALPIYYTQQIWRDSSGFVGGKIVADGIKCDGDNIFICLDGGIVGNGYETNGNSPIYIPEQPSGIWCYDSSVGLYPFALLSADSVRLLTISSVDTGTNILTCASMPFKTGDKVTYNSVSAIGGLVNTQNYFVIYVNSTSCKLAVTYDLAIAGTAIDLTSSGTSSTIQGYTHSDFGHSSIERAGAFGFHKEITATPHSMISQYLFSNGYTIKSDGSTQRHSITSLQKNENRGSITTPKISSNAIQDNYRNFTVKFNGITSGNDKIIIKYRTSNRIGLPYCSKNTASDVATWSNTTTFAITSTQFSNVRAGDEIFFISGAGAGYAVHVQSISNVGDTYTVVIDEAIPSIVNGNVSHFVVDNWTRVLTVTSSHELNSKGYVSYPLGDVSKWFQFKLELRGEGVQIEEMLLDNAVNKA